MTESELIEVIVARHDSLLTKRQTTAVIETWKNVATEELSNGGEVHLHGFGVFAVAETAARTGHNPRTGAQIDIPAGRKVQFRTSKRLKDAIKEALAAATQHIDRRRRG